MKKIFLFFLLSIPGVIYSQNNFIKQITAGDFDARNPSAAKKAFNSYLFYELHKNNTSNIIYSSYNSLLDSFEDTVMITSDNYLNINPIAGYDFIIFQTNKNGNWDIAYKKNINGTWSETQYIANSPNDEINAKRVYSNEYGFNDILSVIFQKDDTVFFAMDNEGSIIPEPVLTNNSQFSYTDYTAVIYSNYLGGLPRAGIHVIAVQTDQYNVKRLVSRYRPINGSWGNLNLIIDSCDCANPTVQFINWYSRLIYEDTLNSEKRLFTMDDWDLYQIFDSLSISYRGNVSKFNSDVPIIITQKDLQKNNEDNVWIPHTFLVENNGELLLRVNRTDAEWFVDDTLITVKYPASNTEVGNLGTTNGFEVFYTVWEDSMNGHIHLFGRKQLVPYGGVEDESIANDFVLYQNYPNPFSAKGGYTPGENPYTTIEYKLLKANDVKFNVFNVLGEKVFEQNFGYQTAGSYKINYSGKDLPSGVYVYSIYANGNRLSRKMLLMK